MPIWWSISCCPRHFIIFSAYKIKMWENFIIAYFTTISFSLFDIFHFIFLFLFYLPDFINLSSYLISFMYFPTIFSGSLSFLSGANHNWQMLFISSNFWTFSPFPPLLDRREKEDTAGVLESMSYVIQVDVTSLCKVSSETNWSVPFSRKGPKSGKFVRDRWVSIRTRLFIITHFLDHSLYLLILFKSSLLHSN